MPNQQQLDKIKAGKGFIAALDQSGGSTPKALRLYGVEETAYSGDAEMYDLIHAMRSRIAKAPAFTGEKVVGAILFEMTMDRQIDGQPTASYMWEKRGVVPFLKVDKGLADEENGVQLMKSMPELDANDIPYENTLYPVGDTTFAAANDNEELLITFLPESEGGESVYLRHRNLVGIKVGY